MKIIFKHLTTIDSTNNWAKRKHALVKPGTILFVTAEEQSAGRGRLNRKWVSPAGQNIYATFAFLIDNQRRDSGNIPQVLALSAIKVLEDCGFHPAVKWPNDLLLCNKKVGGILAESTPLGKHLYFVVGIGVNINMPEEILKGIGQPATSLYAETGKVFSVSELSEILKKRFLQDLKLFFKHGFSVFFETYRFYLGVDRACLIKFHDNQRVWQGFIEKINEDGSLALKLENGEVKIFSAGEVLQN